MKTRSQYEWTISPSSPPLYIHRCSKCKKMMPFFCSDKFRLNAQKKTVDVWLIYKCTKCNSTRNIDILTRVNPKLIDSEEYDRFQGNDVETAWKYAFDEDVLSKNKVQADFSQIEYLFDGDLFTLQELANQKTDLIEFEVNVEYNLDFTLFKLIKNNLHSTNSQLESLLSNGIVSLFPPETNKKSKVMSGQKIIINREKLCKYLEKQNEIEDTAIRENQAQ